MKKPMRMFVQTAVVLTGLSVAELPLALTHEDLADLTGSSRVTITRILGELRNDGALSGTRGVYVADMDGLERATDQYVMQVL